VNEKKSGLSITTTSSLPLWVVIGAVLITAAWQVRAKIVQSQSEENECSNFFEVPVDKGKCKEIQELAQKGWLVTVHNGQAVVKHPDTGKTYRILYIVPPRKG